MLATASAQVCVPSDTVVYIYYIESTLVVQVDVVKDLGVFVDKNLKFDCRINGTVERASSRANLVHKCFLSKDMTVMTQAKGVPK